MSNRTPLRPLAVVITTIALLLAGFAGGVAAQGDETVLLRAFACPDAAPSDPFTECEHMIGATFQIEANGAETAESPVTTVADMGIGPGASLTVPAGADLTITLLSGGPDGYAPAAGFDPFSANVDDLPQVGFGGESTGPGVNFIAVPSDTSDGDDGDDAGNTEDSGDDAADTTTLPETGAGPTASSASDQAAPIALLALAMLLTGAGFVVSRQRAG